MKLHVAGQQIARLRLDDAVTKVGTRSCAPPPRIYHPEPPSVFGDQALRESIGVLPQVGQRALTRSGRQCDCVDSG